MIHQREISRSQNAWHLDSADSIAFTPLKMLRDSVSDRLARQMDWALQMLEQGMPSKWLKQLIAEKLDRETYDRRMETLCRILDDSGMRTNDLMIESSRLDLKKDEQELVSRIGCCTGGCRQSNLVKQDNDGQAVCRRTGEGCPWNDDEVLAIAKMFDWQNVIDLERKMVCPQTTPASKR